MYRKLHNLEPIFPKPEKQIDQSHEKNHSTIDMFVFSFICNWSVFGAVAFVVVKIMIDLTICLLKMSDIWEHFLKWYYMDKE